MGVIRPAGPTSGYGYHPPSSHGPSSLSFPPRVLDTFRYFDRNGSGFLDYRELRNALQYYGLDVSSQGARSVLLRYDDAPDGRLEVAEFAELVRDIEMGVIRSTSAIYSADRARRPPLYVSSAHRPPSFSPRSGSRRNSRSTTEGMNSRSPRGVKFAPLLMHRADSDDFAGIARRANHAAAVARPLRGSMISPLLATRESKLEWSGTEFGLGGALSLLSNPLPSTAYQARNGLEEWLGSLPGLEPQHYHPLLGVRPLQRAEVIARFLRMECSFWEAQQVYTDSHHLYLRQWLALMLQALYRGREARRELWRRSTERWLEQRMRHVLGMWQKQTFTRCFDAWSGIIKARRRAVEAAVGAALRWTQAKVSRAFNQWSAICRDSRTAKALMNSAARNWLDGRAKAFRTWRAKAVLQRRSHLVLLRAAAAFKQPKLRWAMTTWQDEKAAQDRAKVLLAKALGNWTNLRTGLTSHFRHWRKVTPKQSRRGGGGGESEASVTAGSSERDRAQQAAYQQQAYLHNVRQLMARPCIKRVARTGRWREVELRLSRTHLTYAHGSTTRHIPLNAVLEVQAPGQSDVRFGGLMALFRPLDTCWKWSVILSPQGQQAAGLSKPEFHFGGQTQEAMLCWVDAVRSACKPLRATIPSRPAAAAGSRTPPARPSPARHPPPARLRAGGTAPGQLRSIQSLRPAAPPYSPHRPPGAGVRINPVQPLPQSPLSDRLPPPVPLLPPAPLPPPPLAPGHVPLSAGLNARRPPGKVPLSGALPAVPE